MPHDYLHNTLQPNLWSALFNKDTLVNPISGQIITRFISSYSVRSAHSAIKTSYQSAGISLAIPGPDNYNPHSEIGSWRRKTLRCLLDGFDANWTKEKGSKCENSKKNNNMETMITENGNHLDI